MAFNASTIFMLHFWCRGNNPGRSIWAIATSSASSDLWSNVAVYSGPLYGQTNVPAHLSFWILLQWTVLHIHTHAHRLTCAYSHIIDLARMNLFEVLWPALDVFYSKCVSEYWMQTFNAWQLAGVWPKFLGSRRDIFFLLLKPFHSSST